MYTREMSNARHFAGDDARHGTQSSSRSKPATSAVVRATNRPSAGSVHSHTQQEKTLLHPSVGIRAELTLQIWRDLEAENVERLRQRDWEATCTPTDRVVAVAPLHVSFAAPSTHPRPSCCEACPQR
jgi:hypothetical protein